MEKVSHIVGVVRVRWETRRERVRVTVKQHPHGQVREIDFWGIWGMWGRASQDIPRGQGSAVDAAPQGPMQELCRRRCVQCRPVPLGGLGRTTRDPPWESPCQVSIRVRYLPKLPSARVLRL